MTNINETTMKKYIESKAGSWELTTAKSETSRLLTLLPFIDGNPETLWTALAAQKPYSRVTAWTRVSSFYDFCMKEGLVSRPNPYVEWRRLNAKRFKNAYTRTPPTMSLDEARERIARIEDEGMRNRAILLLSGGLRFTESATLKGGTVMGKGAKLREVHVQVPSGPMFDGPYHQFHYALKKVGLKPHLLRKLAATALVAQGIDQYDLMEAMGWVSIETARSYVAPSRKRIAEAFASALHGGSSNEGQPLSRKVS
jgi:integrase